MCKCLEKTEADIKKFIIDDIESKGQKVSEFIDESESGFTCKGLFFSTGNWEFVLPVEYKYKLIKKDGTAEKRVTKSKTNFIPLYCPICGKKTKQSTSK